MSDIRIYSIFFYLLLIIVISFLSNHLLCFVTNFPFLVMQRPHKAYPVELAQFHSPDYVEFLHRINPESQHLFMNEMAKCMTLDVFTFVCLHICAFVINNQDNKHSLLILKYMWSYVHILY